MAIACIALRVFRIPETNDLKGGILNLALGFFFVSGMSIIIITSIKLFHMKKVI